MQAYHGLIGHERSFTLEHAYWGQDYSDDEIQSFLERENIPYEHIPDNDRLIDRVVGELTSGRVVGWFQGRFEWGPRALPALRARHPGGEEQRIL